MSKHHHEFQEKRVGSLYLLVNVEGEYYSGDAGVNADELPSSSKSTVTDNPLQAQVFDSYEDALTWLAIDPETTKGFSPEEYSV